MNSEIRSDSNKPRNPIAATIAATTCLHAVILAGLFFAAAPLVAAGPPAPAASSEATQAWLGDLPVVEARVGWQEFGKPGYIANKLPIALHRIQSPHGLSTPAEASVTFAIGKKFRQFRATAALADSYSTDLHSPVVFEALADGKSVWKSKTINAENRCQPCLLDVAGVERLTLRAIITGSNSAAIETNAVWLEPRLSTAECDPNLSPLFAPQKFLESEAIVDFSRKIFELWDNEKFAELDAIAKEVRKQRTHWLQNPKLFIFYTALERPDAPDEAGHLRLLQRVKRWQQQFPQSATPLIVGAGIWEQLAIFEHGTTFARNVTPEGWRLFIDRMVKAGDYLDQAESLNADDPELYHRYLWLAFAQNLSRDKIDEYVEKAVQIDPTYLPAIRVMAYGLLPRWHGKPGDVAKFAVRIRDRIGGSAGQAAYFTVAENFCVLDRCRPSDAGFSTADLRKATLVAAVEYAGDDWVVQQACQMACQNHDLETARWLFERIPPGGGLGTVWGDGEAPELYRHWADPKRAPGEQLRTLWESDSRITGILAARDGKSVFVGNDRAVQRINLQSGKATDTVSTPDSIINWDVDAAGKRVLLSMGTQRNLTGALRLYEFGSDKSEALAGHRRWVGCVAFNPTGTRAASAGSDRQVILWKLDDLENPVSIEMETAACNVAYSPDGKTLATSTNGGAVALWNGETGAALGKPLIEEGGGLLPPLLQFASDGVRLVVVAKDGAIQIWDTTKHKLLNDVKFGSGDVASFMLSPTGRLLAIGRANADIDLIDVNSLKLLHTFHGHWGSVSSIDFLPSEEMLVSGSNDRTVNLWDLKPFRKGR